MGWQYDGFVGSEEFCDCLTKDLSQALQVSSDRIKIGMVSAADDYFEQPFSVSPAPEDAAGTPDEDNRTPDILKQTLVELMLVREAVGARDFFMGGATSGVHVSHTLDLLFEPHQSYLIQKILQMLDKGASIGRPEDSPHTPLMLAAAIGQRAIARQIVAQAGDQLSVQDASELMNLWLDSPSGDSSLVDELIGGVVDQAGGSIEDLQALFLQACKAGLLQSCERLLLRGVDPQANDCLHMVLLTLGKFPHLPYLEISRQLLEHGADANKVLCTQFRTCSPVLPCTLSSLLPETAVGPVSAAAAVVAAASSDCLTMPRTRLCDHKSSFTVLSNDCLVHR